MLQFVVTLHLLGASVADRARTKLTSKPERGSDTIEKVLWGVAAIAIAGIVVAAVKAYVTSESVKIK